MKKGSTTSSKKKEVVTYNSVAAQFALEIAERQFTGMEQLDEAKRYYYMGASAVLAIMERMGAEDQSDEVAEKVVDGLFEEVQQFIHENNLCDEPECTVKPKDFTVPKGQQC